MGPQDDPARRDDRRRSADALLADVPGLPGSAQTSTKRGHGFGTMPVFLAAISTILGAVMFLRFGYAVAHVGLLGAIAIILLGHMVTVPTALAISEIATNRRVEGGGEYFIISRSFGPRIGSTIGISLYLSQAVSVAFYLIAFAEAFTPLAPRLAQLGIPFDVRMVSVPAAVGLLMLMLTRGAAMGVKALYVVVVVLTVSLVFFFAGTALPEAPAEMQATARIPGSDPFFVVFAICFPAFTGMTAGVGLSGDLATPRRSIPLGTLGATLAGLVVYVAIVWKLAASAPPQLLADDQLAMSRIALWGPIVPIGLACATLSSALGSILVAPRTLQALANDGAFVGPLNRVLARSVGDANEPRNATVLTGIVALVVVALGNVDLVARLISMFFMVTYGALCAVSFLENFAANPSYRPTFRSRWWISLFGAVACLLMMFQMDPAFAVLAIIAMIAMYRLTAWTMGDRDGDDLAAVFRNVMGQATRRLHVGLQRRRAAVTGRDWRPSIIAVSADTFTGPHAGLRMLGWLCARYGFGTYLHYIPGRLDATTYAESARLQADLIDMVRGRYPGVFVDTIVSPSFRTAVAQSLQIPGVSGLENNSILFTFAAEAPDAQVDALLEDARFANVTRKNLLFLRHGERGFGERSRIHVWLTWDDAENATLMMLLVYILLDHRDWHDAEVSVFAAVPAEQLAAQREQFRELVQSGRLPLSEQSIRYLPVNDAESFHDLVAKTSARADLVVKGVSEASLHEKGRELLGWHPELSDVLFVLAAEPILLD